MTAFRRAVKAAPAPVEGAWRPELEALEQHHQRKVSRADGSQLTGSIDLDTALQPVHRYTNAPRWDYGVGYKPRSGGERAIWIEVHRAVTSEVASVLRKRNWLRGWLAREANELRRMTDRGDAGERYIWIAAGRINIPRNSPQARRLSKSGLKLVSHLSLN